MLPRDRPSGAVPGRNGQRAEMSENFIIAVKEGDDAYRRGDHAAAGRAYGRAMAIRASHPSLLKLYADCCRRTGDAEGEWRALRRLLILEPANRPAALRLATVTARTGRQDEGGLIRRALKTGRGKRRPGRWLARLLGGGAGRTPREPIAGLTATESESYRSARRALDRNDFHAALTHLEPLARARHEDPRVLRARAEADLGLGRVTAALDAIGRAVRQGAADPEAKALQIRISAKAERFEAARAMLGALAPKERAALPARLAEATLYYETDRAEEALAVLDAAEAAGDAPALAAELRARILTGQGRFEDARPAFEDWARRAPLSGTPYITAAANRLLVAGSPLCEMAARLAADPDAAQAARAAAEFALARLCAEAGDHAAQMARLERANALVDVVYDPWEEAARVAAIRRHVGPTVLARPAAADRGRGLVFVCGLPRSGSTLAAQVIAAHPEAVSIGESQLFPQLLERAAAAGYPEKTADFSDGFLAELGRAYLDGLPDAARAARFVVDKELAKFRHLGLLHLILPGARIVHLRRDPMDVCFSVYAQNFPGWPATFRQETLAHFHHLHDEIMAHWAAALPGGLHRLRYEDMVADPEGEIHRLLEGVGVPFHPDCLAFQTAGAVVRTASSYQVRQEVYASSVGAWKRHESALRDLQAGLRERPFSENVPTG